MKESQSILLSKGASRMRRLAAFALQGFLFLIASLSLIALLFIIFYIAKGGLPFFKLRGIVEFFTSTAWYPSRNPAEFGALAIFIGTLLVTIGAALVAVPLGIVAAICLSDILPFSLRQAIKPVIEILAAIPSVAYGFFALVVLAPLLQNQGGRFLSMGVWLLGLPLVLIAIIVAGHALAEKMNLEHKKLGRIFVMAFLAAIAIGFLYLIASRVNRLEITSGTNALNVAIILGIMAIPTVVSVAEDALQAAGRELREGSYALGATRAETIFRVVIPAAGSGIIAAVILGVMRAVGETMVVWMASGNAAQIPTPWYNLLEPVRTLTATIAGDMGEADQVTGSARYHVLFAMALCLLLFSFISNLASEWLAVRSRKKSGRK